MNSIINVRFRTLWDPPINVVDRDNRDVSLDGPREAVRYLLDDFVAQYGEAYRNAFVACSAAINNPAYAERAREAFLAVYQKQRPGPN